MGGDMGAGLQQIGRDPERGAFAHIIRLGLEGQAQKQHAFALSAPISISRIRRTCPGCASLTDRTAFSISIFRPTASPCERSA
jgi:hypothetical protein